METSARYKILVVEDHELVRRGLRQLIKEQADFEICAEAAGMHEALSLKESVTPDIAIIDISLPDGNGLDLINKFHCWRPEMRILVLSMYSDALVIRRAFDKGAHAYVSKQDTASMLVDGLRGLINRQATFKQNVSTGNEPSATPLERLTNRELQIFEVIGRGKKNTEIAKDFSLSVKTVEAHRSNIKRKLNMASGVELNRSAILWFMGRH